MHDPIDARRDVLRECGAAPEDVDEVLAYTESPFDAARLSGLVFPLDDEPHVDAWEDYEREARVAGVLPALARRLVQLRFPVVAGISESEAYRAATRRGILPPGDGPGFELRDPDGVTLTLHQTPAGRVPVITAADRSDFAVLVQALSHRNEPDAIPSSMGACIVKGLNNWDRIARHRSRLESERGAPLDAAAWSQAFAGLLPQKPLYQDRLVILGSAPYSGVPAGVVGFPGEEWRRLSLVIRREHEFTHYLSLRVFGAMRNNLLDEVIADFAGLSAALGRYDAGLALRFFGLEAFPAYRAGGRFEIYLATPPASARAAEVLRALVVRAVRNLAASASSRNLADPAYRLRAVIALTGFTLEQIATRDPVLP